MGGDAGVWARTRPAFFFAQGEPNLRELKEQLLNGARTLCTGVVEDLSSGDWQVVAARDDWFARGSTLESGRSLFLHLHAFPELGQNCSRPEFVVHAFAKDVISLGPEGTSIVKGCTHVAGSAVWASIQGQGWRRVVAFRGLDAMLTEEGVVWDREG